MSSFLDKTFNPAGVLRRGLLGLVVGLILAGGIEIIFAASLSENASLIVFLVTVFVVTVLFGIWGAFEKPRENTRTNRYINAYLTFANTLSLLTYFTDRPTPFYMQDTALPERVTIRNFLWHMLLLIGLALIGIRFWTLYPNVYATLAVLIVWTIVSYVLLSRLSIMTCAIVVLACLILVPTNEWPAQQFAESTSASLSSAQIEQLFAPNNSYLDATSSGFMYEGKAVHPACLYALYAQDAQATTTNISSCTQAYEGSTWSALDMQDGFLDSYQSDGQEDQYRVWYQSGNTYVIENIYSGGGSGEFGSVDMLTLQGKELAYDQSIVPTGDRCNGGFTVDSIKNGTLYYSVSLTPSDLIGLGATTTTDYKIRLPSGALIEPYGDLDGSAVSCFALANYSYDVANDSTQFVSVSLQSGQDDPAAQQLSDWQSYPSTSTYQQCFDNLYESYVSMGKTELVGNDIQGFAKAFDTKCVQGK